MTTAISHRGIFERSLYWAACVRCFPLHHAVKLAWGELRVFQPLFPAKWSYIDGLWDTCNPVPLAELEGLRFEEPLSYEDHAGQSAIAVAVAWCGVRATYLRPDEERLLKEWTDPWKDSIFSREIPPLLIEDFYDLVGDSDNRASLWFFHHLLPGGDWLNKIEGARGALLEPTGLTQINK